MITLEPNLAVVIVVALFGAAGSFFAVKFGQAETQRLVKALHHRFDTFEKDFEAVKIEQGRHDERIKWLKESQRMRIQATREAALANQPPMFREGDDG